MELEALRARIDELDTQILDCFMERMALAEEIARCKQARGLPLCCPAREQAILDSVAARAQDTPEARRLFETLFALSKQRQAAVLQKKRYGLIGRTLKHSYSVPIHQMLGNADYALFELAPEAVADFVKSPDIGALNVTMPYKRDVIACCDMLSPEAKATGSVNTLIRDAQGRLHGYNTDAMGFAYMVRRSGIALKDKKVLVLGSGGAGRTVRAVAERQGAAQVVTISRTGADNYHDLAKHADAQVLINATPVGTYPDVGEAPVSLRDFPRCEGVLELTFNPARTALLLEAEALGIPHSNGLPMLVAQAKASEELFFGKPISDAEMVRIESVLRAQMCNIVLIGMPGCGKTTVGKALAQLTGKRFIDLDTEIEKRAGCSIAELFKVRGEAAFRALERAEAARWGKESGCVIAAGGGVVKDEANYASLHQNGRIYHIGRAIDKLARAGRPLSENADLYALYRERLPLYARFGDACVQNEGGAEETARRIEEDFHENIGA